MKSALVAQFLGHVPPMRVFVSMVNRIWGYEGEVVVSKISEGFFLIEFPSVQLSNWVLGRAWHIHHSALVLRRWQANIALLDIAMKEVPTWLTLTGIPPHLITNEGIGWVVSRIGEPINQFVRDMLTVNVCVLVAKGSIYHEIINIRLEGVTVAIKVASPPTHTYSAQPAAAKAKPYWRPIVPQSQSSVLVAPNPPTGNASEPSTEGEEAPVVVGEPQTGGGIMEETQASLQAQVDPIVQQLEPPEHPLGREGVH
ncbi:hypothetical protein LINGRAHAP2_LOCUS10949 [Linum grandiflorum]